MIKIVLEKKIDNAIIETDELMNECNISLRLAEKQILEEKDFKDFLYRTKDTYSKYFATCKLVEGGWIILEGSLNAAIDLANFYDNDITQTLMEICLSDIYRNMEKIADRIADRIIEKVENGGVVIDNLD